MRTFVLSLFAIAANLGFSEIRTIHSFQEAQVEFEKASNETLVLFDVDEVLIVPVDAILRPNAIPNQTGLEFNPPGWETLTDGEYKELLSIMLSSTRYVLLDPAAPQMINQLKKRGVKPLGLTSCWTGTLGVIPSMQHWRIAQLQKVGIDFGPSEELAFSHLVEKEANAPLLKNGILFCGDLYHRKRSTKGDLLAAFLDKTNHKPKSVLFLDDEEKNLLAVQAEVEKRGIHFTGLLMQNDPPKFDEKIAYLQFQTVLNEKKWLSDEEARKKAY